MKNRRPPILIAITGGSGAGKTWLARKLRSALGPLAMHISLDDFYRDCSGVPPDRRATINFDHPRTIDWPAVESALRALRAGRPAQVPRYDFKTHCRVRTRSILRPRPVVVMEGLWLLRRPSLRRLFDLCVFIDCPTRLRRERRLARDLQSRGRTRASVQRQFRETVEPMHARFVAPQKRRADVVLPHDFGRREARWLAAKLKNGALADRKSGLLPPSPSSIGWRRETAARQRGHSLSLRRRSGERVRERGIVGNVQARNV